MRKISAETIERIDGRPVILSVSGGKDSTATGLWLKENEIPFSCVHMDTGWEHEWTETYVRETLPGVLGPVQIVQSEVGGMEDWCKKKGMFPSRIRRWCTQELKIFPFRNYLRGLDDEPVNAVGIRRAESKARSELPEWEHNKTFDCDVWRPLIDWTTQDVIDIHARHAVKPNPLYLRFGVERVGCWPCIFSRKAEIRAVADKDPEQIDRIERLEQEVGEVARARYAARGEPMDQNRIPALFYRRPRPLPIRDVVEWSRTERGGKQLGLFSPDYEREGCMRWGMCDTGEEPTT
jgi:3'-phosphoadenosine 5'-phosphosulfate sulfotransferase (PAPS reductase)/FAD synthetase